MSAAVSAFFSQISDPRFGGTYMTLLNTFNNLGREIPITFGLKLVGLLTFSKCSNEIQNHCETPSMSDVRFFYYFGIYAN